MLLQHQWPLWARDNQTAPPGSWLIWMLMGGRGSGKSRTGAEWIRQRVYDGAQHIALVGKTPAEVRDVMIQNPLKSGILDVFPPHEEPKYLPSRSMVRFHTGAVAHIYSGEEPGALRGPGHDTFWCLVGSTRVLMADGSEQQICDIRAGDKVWTRRGASPVIAAGMTQKEAEVYRLSCVDRRDIIGTANHPVWVAGIGFTPLASVKEGASLCVHPASRIEVSSSTSDGRATWRQRFNCIVSSGWTQTARLLQTIISTIATATSSTIGWTTLSASAAVNTAAFIAGRNSTLIRPKRLPVLWQRWRESGLNYANASWCASSAGRPFQADHTIHESSVPLAALMHSALAYSRARIDFASGVSRPTMPSVGHQGSVPSDAVAGRKQSWLLRWLSGMSPVGIARPSLGPSAAMPTSVVASAPPLITQDQTAVGVAKCRRRRAVWNLTVEGGEYFANGILTHNCDELPKFQYPTETYDNLLLGLRVGPHPQGVVTTTPLPTPLIRRICADPFTVLSRSSTHDNLPNLSETFKREVLRQYEGTRLERQEIYGELLTDTPGALWQYEVFKRVAEPPPMSCVVVAIDPAVTATETSDETGIVTAGMGEDGCGYVLSDVSGRYSPSAWANKALDEYVRWRADRIVCETNNGGDMVVHTIQVAAKQRGMWVRVQKITASRGKYLRAEPIAALYEQGMIYHAGIFRELEQQMCEWIAGATEKDDRIDACTYACTVLFIHRRGVLYPDAVPSTEPETPTVRPVGQTFSDTIARDGVWFPQGQ